MDASQMVVTVLGAGGGGAALLAFINGVFKWLSGASHRERVRNTDIIQQRLKAIEARDEAERERDLADIKRRQAEEHVSILKRQLRENGVEPRERPRNEE